MNRRFLLALLALVAALSMLAVACGDDDDGAADSAADTAAAAPEGPTIKVRGQAFSESETLAEVYAQYLEAKGYGVEVLTAAGFRTEALDSLKNGDIDLTVEYIGGVQTALAPDTQASQSADEVVGVITPLLEAQGSTLLQYSPAIDGDAFVVRGDAEAATISDVKGLDYRFGASSQCYERPQCFLGYTNPDIYDITFKSRKTIEFGPLLGEALSANEVDAVVWNTTAPQIEAEGFKVLEDDKKLHPAQNIAPIVRTEVADAYGEQLTTDLNTLSEQITSEDLVNWNTQTDIDKQESDQVAADWLSEKGLS